jgi:hypothetical protein
VRLASRAMGQRARTCRSPQAHIATTTAAADVVVFSRLGTANRR